MREGHGGEGRGREEGRPREGKVEEYCRVQVIREKGSQKGIKREEGIQSCS